MRGQGGKGAGRKGEGVRTCTSLATICSNERCLLLEEAQVPDL